MNSEEIEQHKTKYNATLSGIVEANPDLRLFRVKPDFQIPDHSPGQYTTLGLGNWEPRAPGCQEENPKPNEKAKLIRRAYSISSSMVNAEGDLLGANEIDYLEFYIVLVRETGGADAPALTPRLFTLSEGDRLFLGEKIAGHYTTSAVKPDDAVIFLSTGTGEAPHNYMLWDLLRTNHKGPIVSVCCVRYKQDLAYLATHDDLERRFANYQYVWLTTREKDVTRKVYIQELIASGRLESQTGVTLDPDSTHIYMCGNPKMIGEPKIDRTTGERTYPQPQGVVEIMEKRGFRVDEPSRKFVGNLHFEKYW